MLVYAHREAGSVPFVPLKHATLIIWPRSEAESEPPAGRDDDRRPRGDKHVVEQSRPPAFELSDHYFEK